MNLLCGCTGKDNKNSPTRILSSESSDMSMLRPPSSKSSRFGFPRASSKVAKPTPESDSSDTNCVRPVCNGSHKETVITQTGGINKSNADTTYTLNPRSLDYTVSKQPNGENEKKHSVFVPRMKKSQPFRPQSTIVTISNRKNDEFAQLSSAGQRANDDCKISEKSKTSGLKSLLSKPFQRDRTEHPSRSTQSLVMKNSQSENALSSKSNGHSGSATNLTRLSLNSSSNSVHRIKSSKPDIKASLPEEAPRKPPRNSLKQPGKSSSTLTAAVNNNNIASSSSLVKPNNTKSRLSFQPKSLSKPSLLSSKTNIGTSSYIKTKDNQHQLATSIDPMSTGRPTVTTNDGSIDGNERVEAVMTAYPSIESATNSQTEGMNGDKKKPMIEICPIAKSEDLEPEKSPIEEKMPGKPCRLVTLPEDEYLALIDEVVSFRKALVELQHHLIGKQDHDDKMREELQNKTQTISALQRQLSTGSLCRHCQNGVVKCTESSAEDT